MVRASILVSLLIVCGCANAETVIQTSTTPAPVQEVNLPSISVRQITLSYAQQMTSQFPAITANVQSLQTLVDCMTSQAMTINGISDSVQTQQSVPIESQVSPMLSYLLESCSGIPSSEWAAN